MKSFIFSLLLLLLPVSTTLALESIDQLVLAQQIKISNVEKLSGIANKIGTNKLVVTYEKDDYRVPILYELHEKLKKANFNYESWLIVTNKLFLENLSNNKFAWESLFSSVALAEKLKNKDIAEITAKRILTILKEIKKIDDAEQVFLAIQVNTKLGAYLNNNLRNDILIESARLISQSDVDILNSRLQVKKAKFSAYAFINTFFEDLYKIHVDLYSDQNLKDFDILRFKYLLGYLSQISLSNSLTDFEKLDSAIDIIRKINPYATKQENFSVLNQFEPILLKKYINKKSVDSQVNLLMNVMSEWPFNLSKADGEILLVNQIEYLNDPERMLAVYWMRAKNFSDQGKFKEADIYFDKAKSINLNKIEKLMGKDFSLVLRYITNNMQMKSYVDRGDLKRALSMHEKAPQEMEFILNFIKKSGFDFDMSGFAILSEIDLKLGNVTKSIENANTILNFLNQGESTHQKNRSKVRFYMVLKEAYEKKEDYEKSSSYSGLAFRAAINSGFLSLGQAYDYFYKAVDFGEYDFAMRLISQINEATKSESKNLYEFTIANDFNQVLPKYVSDLKHSKNKELTRKEHSFEKRELLEKLIYRNTNKFELLMVHEKLSNLSRILNEKYTAAYYAKLYINTFQELRSSLKDSSDQLTVFTEAYSDILKEYVDLFLDINDIESAQITLRIIKENNFFDFINRRSANQVITSKLKISEEEQYLSRKLEITHHEIESLYKQLTIARSIGNNVDSLNLSLAIDNRKKTITKLNAELREAISSNYKKLAQNTLDRSGVKLTDNQALIDYYVQPNSITLIITTKNESRSFVKKVSRVELRKKILNLYSNLSNQLTIDSQIDTKFFDEILGINEIFNLRKKNIKHIKIRTDDLISYLPIDYFHIDSLTLGELFTFQILGLSNTVNVSADDRGILAFGTSKKYGDLPPLPYVKDEINYITQLRSSITKSTINEIYFDNAFTKGKFLNGFKSNRSFVHISTHYTPNQFNTGGNLLLGDGTTISTSEIITEIPSLSNLFMVSLSACETGISSNPGAISSFEGLSTIFNVKGSRYVIGTLWKVSDQPTADFMSLFYKLIIEEGIPPINSLQITKSIFKSGNLLQTFNGQAIKLRQDSFMINLQKRLPRYTNPFYWAPFTLIGSVN